MKYFTADCHLDHNKVIYITDRNFDTIEEMNDCIIGGINKTVSPKDELYILGDFTFVHFEYWRSKINCKNVYLITGNHDPKKVRKSNCFRWVRSTSDIEVMGHKTWLSHYSHVVWPASHYGSFHLYGHSHARMEDYLDSIWPDRRSMDVGVDNAKRILGQYRPFSEDEIYDILSKRGSHHKIGDKKNELMIDTEIHDLSGPHPDF